MNEVAMTEGSNESIEIFGELSLLELAEIAGGAATVNVI